MTDNKFADTDIAKALKCCADKKRCHDCPFCVTSIEPCYITLAREAASLLSRRDAEIERLKSEAIKEFAERLKESSFPCDVSFGFGREHCEEAVTVLEIDNLVKEMTEETP